MSKPSTGLVLKIAMGQGLREILFLPLWWYTSGLKMTMSKLARSVRASVHYFGVDVWLKNLFVPMYGDTSFTGRVISLFVRSAVLVARFLGVCIWFFVAITLAFVYITILPVSIFGFVFHLIGVFI